MLTEIEIRETTTLHVFDIHNRPMPNKINNPNLLSTNILQQIAAKQVISKTIYIDHGME